jgi:hypothetical protein
MVFMAAYNPKGSVARIGGVDDPSSQWRPSRTGTPDRNEAPGVSPDTPVLMSDLTWKPARDVSQGDLVLGFDKRPKPRRYRRCRLTTVEEVAIRRADTLTLETCFGAITCTPTHCWMERNRFRKAATIGELRLATIPVPPPVFGSDYKMGYLHGAMAGDGAFSRRPTQIRATLRVCDRPFASRFAQFGRDLGFDGFREFVYVAGYTMRPLYGVRTSRVKEVSMLDPYSEPRPTIGYMRGWLAGVFDAEGSSSGGQMLRIHQRLSNSAFWDTTARFLRSLDVAHAEEKGRPPQTKGRERMGSLRILKVADQIKFMALTQPVIRRKWAHLRKAGLRRTPKAFVLSRREVGVRKVISITTSNSTLIAGGFLSQAR